MNAPLTSLSPNAEGLAAALAEIDAIRDQLAVLESRVLGNLAQPGAALFPRKWVDRLANVVAVEFGVHVHELRGLNREQRLTRPRFTWVWLVKMVSGKSYPEVARLCGYGDHTSVMHACRRVDGWRDRYSDFTLVTDQLVQIGKTLRQPPAPVEEAGQ